MERRLAAILAADIVGYSARMGAAEEATLAHLARLREVLECRVGEVGGRIFFRAGDGFLAEFASPVSAVRAGFEVQRDLAGMRRRDPDTLTLRIGIHLADVIVEDGDLLGDGINIAARVEAAAEPGSVTLTQAIYDQVKRTAQLTFEDKGERQLKNITEPMRLYQIVGEIDNHSHMTGTLAPAGLPPIPIPQAIEPNSIVVLPFVNLSADAEQQYFADGFSEDLITDLSRFKDLFVVSRNASFAYRDRDVDARKVGVELGVAYCLQGSVRKMGTRVRIAGQLITTRSGDHIWADRYDCTLDELFDTQDQLAASIVSTVVGKIEITATASAKRKAPNDMAAYDCLMRGLEHHRLGGVTRDEAVAAVRWFDQAIAKDPDYGRAHAWRACSLATLGEWDNDPNWLEACAASGRRALELDENEAESHRIMGSIFLIERQYAKADYHFHRALELNPNHAYIVGRVGELYNFLGEGEKALEMQRQAKRLDPFLPEYCRELEAVAYYVLERFDQVTLVVAQLPRLTRRAAAYNTAATRHAGKAYPLKAAVDDLLRIDPNFSIAAFVEGEYYKEQALTDRLVNDLTQAGLPR